MSTPFPPATPTDSNIRLPRSRRLVWEHVEDVRVANTWLIIIVLVLGFVSLAETMVLLNIFQKPPVVLQEDAGYVMWRTTDVYQLREDIVRTYLTTTLGTLLDINPGAYDVSQLDSLVGVPILKKYGAMAQGSGETRLKQNQRQIFSIYDVRRVPKTDYPNLITFAVRGEKVTYAETKDEAGNVRVTPDNYIALYLVYLQQVQPRPKNPWGLFMAGIKEVPQNEAEHIWGETVAIAGTRDSKGQTIKPAKAPPK